MTGSVPLACVVQARPVMLTVCIVSVAEASFQQHLLEHLLLCSLPKCFIGFPRLGNYDLLIYQQNPLLFTLEILLDD